MKILIIDNYDSFTFNLYHYFQQLVSEVEVLRNDQISLQDLDRFTHLVISPGPGVPSEAGMTMELIERCFQEKPILGVCLGCQALAEFSGGSLYNQQLVAHGISRSVKRCSEDSWLLQGLPQSFKVGLYHSWAVDEDSLDPSWRVTSRSEEQVLMSFEHIHLPIAAVQFHPESVMSEYGLQVLRNWLVRSSDSLNS